MEVFVKLLIFFSNFKTNVDNANNSAANATSKQTKLIDLTDDVLYDASFYLDPTDLDNLAESHNRFTPMFRHLFVKM